ncbi:hypothetical protein ACHAPT_010574 [Fusarium lateritium]
MPPVRTEKQNTASADAAPIAKPKSKLLKPIRQGEKDAYFESRKPICEKIWHFIFEHKDVSYNAHNSAKDLTTEAVIRLAKACPNLKRIELQAASSVGEEALLALFQNCSKLTYLELSGYSRGNGLTGSALDALRENPEWAPRLKKLLVGEDDTNKDFMKAMRALDKEREAMMITLLKRSESKNYGDWDLEVNKTNYKKGRKQTEKFGSSWYPPKGGMWY